MPDDGGRAVTAANFDVGSLALGEAGVHDFYWPVDRREVIDMRDAYLKQVVPLLRSDARTDPQARLIGLLANFLGEVLSTYQAQALIRRSANDGRAARFCENSRVSSALAANRMPDDPPVLMQMRRGLPSDAAWRQGAKALRDRWQRKSIRYPFRTALVSSQEIVTVAMGEMIAQHARAVGPVNYLPLSTWFAPLQASDVDSYCGAPRNELIDSVIDCVRAGFAAGNEPLLDPSAAYLRAWLTEAITLCDRYMGRLLKQPRRIPRNLWRGTGGIFWSRLLSLACHETGGHVTGHDHSHGQGPWQSYSDSVLELPYCDRFMVWTEQQRIAALANFDSNMLPHDEIPEIVAIPGVFEPKPIQPWMPRTIRDTAKKTVMYVGTLYPDDFVPFTPLIPGPVLADWEARLITTLHTHGFEVLVKPHPESANQPDRASFERLGAKLVDGRFEEVCGRADVVLFGQANSTPFFAALSTRIPIVLPNAPLNPWQPDALALAKKRCAFAQTHWNDTDNRLSTDIDSLLAAIDLAPSLSDDGFYETYFAR